MLPDHQEQQLYEAIFAGRKIEAIKLYREFTGAGLKDAKDLVDSLELDLRAESPERFMSPALRSGCASMLALAVASSVGVMWLLLISSR